MSDTFTLGDMGEALVRYGLEKVYKDVRTVPKNIDDQLVWGDLVVPGAVAMGLKKIKVEVKTERVHTGNVFWEQWSNRATGREGWGKTSPADELFYLFWGEGIGYRFPRFQNLMWLVDYYQHDFPLVEQKKYEQGNDSWGRLIPITWFQENNDVISFDFNGLREEMPDTKNPASED